MSVGDLGVNLKKMEMYSHKEDELAGSIPWDGCFPIAGLLEKFDQMVGLIREVKLSVKCGKTDRLIIRERESVTLGVNFRYTR